MTWVSEKQYKWYESLAMNTIKAGPIPRHVAFIMDGNRRYAKANGLENIEGHAKGFDKLSELLTICRDIGIKEVTTFAFSIENFKRSKEEVSDLLNLALTKFQKLVKEEKLLKEKGVRVKIIGNIFLLPDELQKIIAKVMLITENNDKLFLNIAFAYTSRDEMRNSIQKIIEHGDELNEEDITHELLEEFLYTTDSSSPDLLIRTSGECRISDFLMWQISTTIIHFSYILWPAITLWHFLYVIFCYQCTYTKMAILKENENIKKMKWRELLAERIKRFLDSNAIRNREVLLEINNHK